MKRKAIPPCAASIGCLCVAHASGARANAPCDAVAPSETTLDNVVREIMRLASQNRAIKIQAYTLNRWAEVLTRALAKET